MKTVVYQIPVSPVELKKGREPLTDMANALQKINNAAYHIANRAVTLWLNYLYPEPDNELVRLKEARGIVGKFEAEIKTIYDERTVVQKAARLANLIKGKRTELNTWENKVIFSSINKKIEATVKAEFPAFPDRLRTGLLRKVALDWMYTFINQHKADGFSAHFPFYRHEMHLPLCYDNGVVKWRKNNSHKNQIQQYTLRWLNNIELVTNFEGLDKRLPGLLELLYFSANTVDVRNRKPHHYLMPTLKQAGTKWSIHIPVLENVIPVPAEQEEPLYITFGFHYPVCYAWGSNHAKPLGIDNGKYILQQMKNFSKRIQKVTENKKQDVLQKKAKIESIRQAEKLYLEILQNKTVNAIIEVAKKAQKNRIVIERLPITAEQQPAAFRELGLPLLHERLLCGVENWTFDAFYDKLGLEAKKYNIQILFTNSRWTYFNLYTNILTYDEKDRRTRQRVKKVWNLDAGQRRPYAYHGAVTDKSKIDKLEGYLIFRFKKEFNNTNGGLTLYASPRHGKRKTDDFVYRLHIDINMAMNAAFTGKAKK
jgi:hypothetical protein